MNKVQRDGKIAVLYSANHGAGWYSWHGNESLLYDPMLIDMIEKNESQLNHSTSKTDVSSFQTWIFHETIVKYLKSKSYDVTVSDSLSIQWIDAGSKFRIDEYDGSETIVFENDYKWLIA
jgi:hypothetical protein